jgi:hypothetical protein
MAPACRGGSPIPESPAVDQEAERPALSTSGQGSVQGSRQQWKAPECASRRDSRGEGWSRHSDLNRGPAVYETRGGVLRSSVPPGICTPQASRFSLADGRDGRDWQGQGASWDGMVVACATIFSGDWTGRRHTDGADERSGSSGGGADRTSGAPKGSAGTPTRGGSGAPGRTVTDPVCPTGHRGRM